MNDVQDKPEEPPDPPRCRHCNAPLDFVPSDVLFAVCGGCQRVEDMMAYSLGS